MASLIHWNLSDPAWVLPDRNTIPGEVPFFQKLRLLMAELCHKRGIFAIGGMTALYPSRTDAELNERALKVLARDKKNEADCFMDGARTGHPDQNEIALAQFPAPNQLDRRPEGVERYPNLRALPTGVGKHTLEGTRAAARTTIRYRNGVINGRGASLLDGYMEDLATDRIYRLMITHRMRHRDRVTITDPTTGEAVPHTPEKISEIYDEELARLLTDLEAGKEAGTPESMTAARHETERMIMEGLHDPV
jgi:malate synthase